MEILGPAPTTPHGIPDKAYVDTGIPQWSNVITYEQYAVTNSAGTLYYSINAANLNHDPVADTSHTYWALIVSSTGGSDPSDPIPQWSSTVTYSQYAITNVAGILYYSVNAANLNHDPVADTSHTFWAPLISTTGSQSANTVLAAPNGSAGVPSFRSLVGADIPTLNQDTTGTAATVTGATQSNITSVSSGSNGLTVAGTAGLTLTVGSATSGSGSFFKTSGTPAPAGTDKTVYDGNFYATNMSASTLTSSVADGTAPLTVTSLTKVANLNADLLDGYNTSTSASSGTIPVQGNPTTFTTIASSITTGIAPLTVLSTTLVDNLNADLLDGYNTSTSASGNTIPVQGHATTFTTIDSTASTGTAPLTVASTTKVVNLNADLVDGYNSSTSALSGYIPIQGNATTFTTIASTDTTDNTLGTTGSGAVQISGGVGISKNLTVGGSLNLVSDSLTASSGNLFKTSGTPAPTGTDKLVYDGNFYSTNAFAKTFTSSIATGTAPLSVSSTTKVDNLNADLLDGYNTSTSASSGTIPVQGNATTFTTIASTDTTDNTLGTLASGAVQISGGVGMAKNVSIGGSVNVAGSGDLTLASGSGIFSQTFTGTTANAVAITANSLTSGAGLSVSSNSTTRTTGSSLVSLSATGTNSSSGIEVRGLSSSITKTGTTSTNVAAYLDSSGATTNYSLYSASGLIKQNDSTDNTLGTAASGSIQTAGGAGIAKNLTVGGSLNLVAGSLTSSAGNLFKTSATPAPAGTARLVYDGNFYSTNLSANTLTTDSINFDTGAAVPAWAEGRVFYDAASHSLAYYNESSAVTVNLGQEQLLRAENNTGTTITNGMAVYLNGSHGNRPTIAPAIATSYAASRVIGIATQDILTGDMGYVTISGSVHDLNLPSSTYTAGDKLYLSETTAGAFRLSQPGDGYFSVTIGTVVRAHPNQGELFVQVQIESMNNLMVDGQLRVDLSTDATSSTDTSASVFLQGGVAIAKKLYVGTSITAGSAGLFLTAGSATTGAGSFFKTSGTPAPAGTDKTVYDGNFYSTNAFAKTFTSSIATGTAPFSVSSTTKVTNLNVDLLDGAHLDTDGTLAANSDTAIPTQKAVKTYADNIAAGLDLKESVIAASHPGDNVGTGATALTITGVASPLVLDGITISLNDRVLIKDQSTTKSSIAAAAQNGIYYLSTVGTGSNGVLTRTADADNTPGVEVTTGMYVFVETGTQSGEGWILAGVSGAVTLGTTALNFTQFSNANKVALNLQSNATTGTMRITGPAAESTRIKTIRDADDTLLEAGGSYTPSGTWTSLKLNENVALTTTSTKLNYLTNATGTTGTTSTAVVFSTSPTLTTPTIAQINGSTVASGTLLLQSTSDVSKGVVTITGSGVTLSHLTTGGVVLTTSSGVTSSVAILTSDKGGTGNGFTKFSGPTTTERTKTLSDANDTILELGGSYTPSGTWTSMKLTSPAITTSLTLNAGANISMTSGSGTFTQDYTGTTVDAFTINANSQTTGSGLTINSNALTTGSGINLVTVASSINSATTSNGIYVLRSGTYVTSAHVAQGVYSIITATGTVTKYAGRFESTGTGTANYGVYANAIGATANYAVYVASGNVNVQGLTASNIVMTDSSKNLTSLAILTSVNGGTGNGFTKFSGPTTAERTKTLRDADDTVLELGGSYTPSGTWTSLKLNENVALTTTSTKLNYLTSAGGTTGTSSTNIVFSDTPTLSTPTIAQINGSTTASGTLLLQSSSNATKGVVTITGSGVTLSHLTTAGVILTSSSGVTSSTAILSSTYGGTGNGFTKFSGPTSAERTKTLRDANDTILELAGDYTPSGTWTSLKLNENVALTTTSTKLNYLTSASGTTGTNTTSIVFSTSPALTTPTIVTSITSSSHDSASLGTSALGWSDLYLGTGGVITWGAASTPNVTLTHSTGILTLSGTLALGSNNLTMTGSLGATGAGKLTKGWFTDLEITNLPSINGTAITTTAAKLNYLTNAGGTTGTDTTNIVFSTSPTITTPTIAQINGSTSASGTLLLQSSSNATKGAVTITGSGVTLSHLTTAGVILTSSSGVTSSTAILTSVNGGTGNGFTKFSGPTTAERTKTLRDADDTVLELGGSYTPTGTWTSMSLTTPTVTTSLTLNANANLTMSSGTGVFSQTFTGTTTNAHSITANSLTSGNSFYTSTTSTARTATAPSTTTASNSLVAAVATGTNATTSAYSIGYYAYVANGGTTPLNYSFYGAAGTLYNAGAASFGSTVNTTGLVTIAAVTTTSGGLSLPSVQGLGNIWIA